MEEEVKPPQEQAVEQPLVIEPKKEETKKPRRKFFIPKAAWVGLLVLVLVAASAGGAYLWRDSVARNFEKEQSDDITGFKATIITLEKQLADAKVIVPPTCTEVAPNATAIANIKASITSANTAALEGYMATSVNVILAASEAYGAQTPTQAIADISNFLSTDITSWDYDFSPSAAVLADYRDGDYSQYFPTVLVAGTATNKQVVSFSFNCSGKIDTVFLATNENLL